MSTHDTATHNRPQWGSTPEYYLVALGYAVGYGSLWRFPYLVYNNGGGAFLIPYFFFVIVLCFPMFPYALLGNICRTAFQDFCYWYFQQSRSSIQGHWLCSNDNYLLHGILLQYTIGLFYDLSMEFSELVLTMESRRY